MAISAQSFPGFYATVKDDSFFPRLTSRFHAGLIGVASKGPFDTATSITDLKDFRRIFGLPVTGTHLAVAAGMIAASSDGTTIVRVGRQYVDNGVVAASGTIGAYTLYAARAKMLTAGDYVRITQPGKATTVNARLDPGVTIDSSATSLSLVNSGDEAVALAATYDAATVTSCPVANAANEAESFLTTYTYGSTLLTATGSKNGYQLTSTVTPVGVLAVGDLIKISQTGRNTTREVRVKAVHPDNTIDLETSSLSEYGYQALPLQDSYTAGLITKTSGSTTSTHLLAASAGTWANSTGGKTGLVVKVSPGSLPDTKKFVVYEDSGVVETIDNLVFTATDAYPDVTVNPNYAINRINGSNGLSDYINIFAILTNSEPPSNTINPWASNTTVNVTSFTGGWNGENVAPADFVGTLSPSDDTATGLKIFEDPENLTIDVICAPGVSDTGGTSFIAVHQEIARICDRIHAIGYIDVPDNLNLREATDWHNGEGLYTGRGKLDTFRLSCFWNWIQVTDPFTGESVWTSPAVGALQRTAVVYDTLKPWYAIAGEKQGVISSAGAVRYERVSLEAKNGSYGNGNSINSILRQYGQIMIYGDRTMQRAESKLTELHSVHLVNHIVRNFGAIGRRFTFDPNDPVLISQLDLEFRQFLKGVVNERGVEQYLLEVGATAAERNRREVHVNLQVIPTSVMEKMFLNVTVRESGAVLTAVGNL